MQAFVLIGIKPPSLLNHFSPREKVCSFHGRPCVSVSIARTRPRSVTFTPTRCCTAPADPASEEEVLDETAMRAAEIHEVLSGLEEFKTRIVDDATKLAKKVRAPKKQLEAALAQHPDILKIDGHIAELQEELKQLGDR